MTKGYIHSLESFGSVDGPGVRYLIFTTGCAMRCQFCHNPDTWNMNSGTLYTADELIDKAWKYRTYWGSKGGITVSGGEPLLQIDFLLELFQKAKERGINTTLDTCGNPFTREEPFFSKFQELMKVTDLVMLDIKHIDDEQHKILTTALTGGVRAVLPSVEANRFCRSIFCWSCSRKPKKEESTRHWIPAGIHLQEKSHSSVNSRNL